MDPCLTRASLAFGCGKFRRCCHVMWPGILRAQGSERVRGRHDAHARYGSARKKRPLEESAAENTPEGRTTWRSRLANIKTRLAKHGVVALASFAMFNTTYYIAGTTFAWFAVFKVARGIGMKAGLTELGKIYLWVFLSTYALKILRLLGILMLAPSAEKLVQYLLDHHSHLAVSKNAAVSLIVFFCICTLGMHGSALVLYAK